MEGSFGRVAALTSPQHLEVDPEGPEQGWATGSGGPVLLAPLEGLLYDVRTALLT